MRIENPHSQGKRHTSARKARRLVMRGLAVWATVSTIRLLASRPVFQERGPAWIDRQIDDAIERNHPGGIVFWNGCDHRRLAMHKPGEMPSFERPDARLR